MIDALTAEARCAELLAAAKKAGAERADAIASAHSSESVTIRLGALEDVERSESEGVALRVFVGQRSASIHTSDYSPAAMQELAERAVAMAKAAPEDRFAGLAEPELLAKAPFPDCDLADPAEPSPEELKQRALTMEDAGRAVAGVTNSEGASAGFGRSVVALVASNGFSGSFSATGHQAGAVMIAGEGGAMQRDYVSRAARYLADLPPPDEIGNLAGTRAVARLNPGEVKSGVMPVVFDRRLSGSLVSHMVRAMAGDAIARRASFLVDKLDTDLFPASLTISDDPLQKRGLASRPFDGEGLPSKPRVLVEGGRLTGWLTDLAAARQLGVAPTGHGARGGGGAPGIAPTNVTLAAGKASRSALIADISEGVLISEVIGHGVNGVTGDYSLGAAGFRIVGGEIAGPIAEFTIAGNLLEMFAQMTPADDLEYHRAVNAPSLRIEGMTVAGE